MSGKGIRIRLKKTLASGHGPFALDVDIELRDAEIASLFGPSGAGKTTLLRLIAGLSAPDEGLIEVDGKLWLDTARGINLPPQAREVGFVFQEYNLFPNMTVRQNLRYALGKSGNEREIDELLQMTHLVQLADRGPETLSGGQKQRVALVRALLRKPKIFLLDEPFSALDLDLRLNLQGEFLSLHERFRTPALFVTHDLSETFRLSQKVFVMKDGKITRSGAPGKVFGKSDGFSFVGTVLEVGTHDVTLQVGHDIVTVEAPAAASLRIGDRVSVSAQAANPVRLET